MLIDSVRKLAYRIWATYRYPYVLKVVLAQGGLTVQGGPFSGMVYVPSSTKEASQWTLGSVLIPKLLGCYEAELHNILACIFETGYAEVLNIGCGEGYYAIGIALRLPCARVYAFEANPFIRQMCIEMAHANGVASRVLVTGKCDIEHLRTLALEQALIICDCEGCEIRLLQPRLVPSLTSCDILVELHDFIDPSISQTILSRFAPTHNIELINSVQRDPVAYPALHALKIRDRHLAINEFRPNAMQWAFMTVKGR
jgi:hypothetical protein